MVDGAIMLEELQLKASVRVAEPYARAPPAALPAPWPWPPRAGAGAQCAPGAQPASPRRCRARTVAWMGSPRAGAARMMATRSMLAGARGPRVIWAGGDGSVRTPPGRFCSPPRQAGRAGWVERWTSAGWRRDRLERGEGRRVRACAASCWLMARVRLGWVWWAS